MRNVNPAGGVEEVGSAVIRIPFHDPGALILDSSFDS